MIRPDVADRCPHLGLLDSLLRELPQPPEAGERREVAHGLWQAMQDHCPRLLDSTDLPALVVGRWNARCGSLVDSVSWTRPRIASKGLRQSLDWLLPLPRQFPDACALVAARILRWHPASPWHAAGAWEVHLQSLSGDARSGFDLSLALTGTRLASLFAAFREGRNRDFAVVLGGLSQPSVPLLEALRPVLDAAHIPVVMRQSA